MAGVEDIGERDVAQHVFRLLVLTVGLSPVPYAGGVVVGIVNVVEGIGSEDAQRQVLAEENLSLQVDIEVSVVLILYHLQQRQGVADPKGFRHLIVFPYAVLRLREGGIEGGGRKEQALLVGRE